jgi:DNA-binding transcriptional MerR regulator
MIDESKLTKFYHTITDVSQMFELNDSTLRYWESEFTQLHPKKNRKGDRRYTKEDILVVDKIYTLLKEKGYTLKGAKEELKSMIKTEKLNEKVIKKLNKVKKNLMLLKVELDES